MEAYSENERYQKSTKNFLYPIIIGIFINAVSPIIYAAFQKVSFLTAFKEVWIHTFNFIMKILLFNIKVWQHHSRLFIFLSESIVSIPVISDSHTIPITNICRYSLYGSLRLSYRGKKDWSCSSVSACCG